MIRYKNRTFEEYSICPATGDIFDAKTGEVQPLKMNNSRPTFKGLYVHQIMAHTFYGYKPDFVVHHLDENKLNNALSNLVYLTREEHTSLHSTILLHNETRVKLSAASKGRKYGPRSEETRAKLSAVKKGKTTWVKGTYWWNNGLENKRAIECPGEGWKRGQNRRKKS